MKKKCLIYANCQGDALKVFLPKVKQFDNEYEIIDLKPVHKLSKDDIPLLETLIKETDLFIHQPIADNYKNLRQLSSNYLKSKLQKKAKSISFPNIYFTAYNPELTGLKNENGMPIMSPFSYYDYNILYLLAAGKSIQQAVSLIKMDNFYSKDFLKNVYESSLSILSNREDDLDIKVVSYIERYFKEKKLFHTYNHPKNVLLFFLVERIISQLYDKRNFEFYFPNMKNRDVLSRTMFPIYNSVKKVYGLDFYSENVYKIDNEFYTDEEFYEANYRLYKDNTLIIEQNLKRIDNVFTVTRGYNLSHC